MSAIASSGDFDSRMSLTSIRCPEKAKERTSDTTSCRLWISSRKKSDTRATEPETSQIATIFGLSRCLRFHAVRKGTLPQAALRAQRPAHVEMAAALPLARLASSVRAGAAPSGGSARASARPGAARSGTAARCAGFRCAGFRPPRGRKAVAPARPCRVPSRASRRRARQPFRQRRIGRGQIRRVRRGGAGCPSARGCGPRKSRAG